MLLLPFFTYPSEVLKTFEEFGINNEKLEEFISTLQETKKETFFEKQKSFLLTGWKEFKNFFVIDTLNLQQNIEYSHEVNKIFEKDAL